MIDGKKLYAIDDNMNYVDIIETGKWKLQKGDAWAEPKKGALTHDGSKTIMIPNLNSRDIAFLIHQRKKFFFNKD